MLIETRGRDVVYAWHQRARPDRPHQHRTPDGGVRVETYYQDGSLLSVTGNATHPVQFLYSVDGDGPFTTEIKVTETGGTNEWVKTSTDLLGRAYKTTYVAASAPYPFSLSTFNSKGQLTNQVDPDGVITLLAYNPKGEQVYSVLDSNRNSTIDFSGSDQITFTTNDVVAAYGSVPQGEDSLRSP